MKSRPRVVSSNARSAVPAQQPIARALIRTLGRTNAFQLSSVRPTGAHGGSVLSSNAVEHKSRTMGAGHTSMRDVARAAGVSLATVSYVVNRGPKPVAAATRKRLVAAIHSVGYQAGRRGRARTRPLTTGAIVPAAP